MPHAEPTGLTTAEATKLLERHGPNEVPERRAHPLLALAAFFWGPIPWMIEVAAALSIVLGHWDDVAIILTLLVINAAVGFWQEHHAQDAVDALKRTLAPTARVKRDGAWTTIPARELVPGDMILVRLGDVIPADALLADCDPIEVDESMLTGESLPRARATGETVYAGSIVRKGEMDAVVTATGTATTYGKTVELVRSASSTNHLQKEILRIGNYLIAVAVALAALLVLAGLFRHESLVEVLQFSLILAVAAIPAAMPAVLTTTMALGARTLASLDAIVTKLESIHELAGMDVLCCDKTGTLTKNELAVEDALPMGAATADGVLRAAKLASKRQAYDPIDAAVLRAKGGDPAGAAATHFVPFDPVTKRTEATVEENGGTYRVSKGSVPVIVALCGGGADLAAEAARHEEAFATKGMRTLGVARSGADGSWTMLGVLALSDPPREDARAVLQEARSMGVSIKMITGDQLPIARETARRLGLGDAIMDAATFEETSHERMGRLAEDIERADGFAKAFPDHKYFIVESLQKDGHIVGMTGDGVNDAPALKKADVGVAVHGALDAARGAADIVLLQPGLSVIVDAIKESRRIFKRMTSYAIYRIAETMRVLLFVTLSVLVFRFYPVTAVMVILLALLNDGAILTIAFDNADVGTGPRRWDMRAILTVSTALGVVGVASSFLLFYLAERATGLSQPFIQTLMYLKLSVAGHLMIFHTRTRRSMFDNRPAWALLGATLATQCVATLIAVYGVFVEPIGWKAAGLVWLYAAAWIPLNEAAKRLAYRVADER